MKTPLLLALVVVGSIAVGCGSGEDTSAPVVDPKAAVSPVEAGGAAAPGGAPAAGGPGASQSVAPTPQ